jgi:NTP pyrophosphatase (non-canonical NTP hydrolase)
MPNEEDKCECGSCGSIYSYQRDVSVSYCSQPVKPNDVKKIKGKVMTTTRYQQEVKRTMPKLLAKESELAMLAMGVADEAGEFLGHIKKVLFHGHDDDRGHVVEELGDILWYVSNICNHYGLDIHEVMERNIEKLNKRYPDGFSHEKSRNRSV